MKRKLAVLMTGAMVMATLAGCGGGNEAAPAAAPAAAEEEAPAAEEEAEAPAAEEEAPAAEEEAEAPAASGDLITVGIINNDPSESGYRTANDADLKAAFTEENGYSASFAYGNPAVGNANEDQVKAAQQFIQNGVDYLLLSAADTAGWDTVLQDAQDAGVEVILFDRTIDADESLYLASIVSDMDKEGETAVNWLADQGLDEYNIIHLQGQMGSAAQQGRTKALDEKVAAEANWNMVEQQTASWNAENAQQIVQSVISSGKSFNVIYAENDDMAKGAVAALDAANISHGVGKDVIIMGFDCNKWALEELLAGNWNYDGQCNPFQSSYIDDVIKNGAPAEKVIIMDEKGFDATTITAEDVENYGI
ncbi:MAG: substrate-binding domain-containing protein [Lachnospiraceae bacterium]|nr:substrate-binding domain-containing protein [Lachnospiraceae bacterium]